MTGRFPPRKQDMERALRIGVEMFQMGREQNQAAQALSQGTPNMAQLVEFQKLGLRRAELTLELTKLMKAIPQSGVSPQVAQKLQGIQDALAQADSGLVDVQKDLLSIPEGP